jgi:hypothetical protein
LVETAITLALLAIFIFGILATVTGLQSTFVDNEVIGELHRRAQRALERIVQLSSQALTDDEQFAALKPTTGVDSHCLRFSLVTSVDTVTAEPIYSSNIVYIYGPDDGDYPCSGIIVGRGPGLDTVYTACGDDGRLGTSDDNTSTLVNGDPLVELLVPSEFAPSSGEMLQIDVAERMVTFTLRLNAHGTNGAFVLPNDLVLTERVALRQ